MAQDDKIDRLTDGDRRTLDHFKQVKALKEKAGGNVTWTPMMATDEARQPNYDLSKADPDCELCSGLGYRSEVIKDEGETKPLMIICRCVDRNGGIREGALPGQDRMRKKKQRSLLKPKVGGWLKRKKRRGRN